MQLEQLLTQEECWLSNGKNRIFFDHNKNEWKVIKKKRGYRHNIENYYEKIENAIDDFNKYND